MKDKNNSKILDKSLSDFDKISLKEMDSVSLLKRTETKYVMALDEFMGILPELSNYYRVLEIDGNRKNRYATVYFDTKDFLLYNKHHNGLANRHKIRTREYVDTNLSFIEIKFKDNKRKTSKKRMEVVGNVDCASLDIQEFVDEKSGISWDDLAPSLYNHYTRITMVDKNLSERLTIDLGLTFFDDNNKNEVNLSNLVIIEIKQEKFSRNSAFIQLMGKHSIQPVSFSKYCIGMSLTNDFVKKNNFKEKLMMVNKMHGGNLSWK